MQSSLLFAFVDPKDPFTAGEIAGEPSPGPLLSILSARAFTDAFLFHTPQTRENAEATLDEIAGRHPGCRVEVRPLPVSDPKDYSAIMGSLGRQVRGILAGHRGAELSVCVSSGTAEMRAAWFLLRAANVLPARLLQVGSPAAPLFGAAGVKEVSLEGGDWSVLRDLVMPIDYFTTSVPDGAAPLQSRIPDKRGDLERPLFSRVIPCAPPPAAAPEPEAAPHPELDAALSELSFHIHSPKMRLLAQRAAIVAECDEATLIHGETGTGKELVAKLVHRLSPRHTHKMVTVNCGAIPQELAESQLFGHVRGGFTGAVTDREGVFEAAHGSTLFLDEIGELTLACQAKILRAVQFGEFEKVGSAKTVRVNVRVIAATHRNLKKEIAKGAFRNDLYQRLNILGLEIPPLRERSGEIPELALAILKDINARRQQPRQISKEGLRRLELYEWPGNVRELDAALRRSVAFASGPVLRPEDILIDSSSPTTDPFRTLPEPGPGFSLEHFLDQARAHLILRALEKAGGNQTSAAAMLGISKQAVSRFIADNRR
ncbi:MAG: RNA repair transcriptional activator RtcR family protein [Candidatus Sulfopaludibacter sp.]|nr:RNA repair transcriptional activator RtcR family protein [Candidatus Sulfopaludibacter sp.]